MPSFDDVERWIRATGALLLLPTVNDPEIALALAKLFTPLSHATAWSSFDIVESLGVEAIPVLRWIADHLPGREEKREIKSALAVVQS